MEIKKLIYSFLSNKIFYIREAFAFFSNENLHDNFVFEKDFSLEFIVSESDLALIQGLEKLPVFWVSQFYKRLSTKRYKMLVVSKNNQLCYFAWVGENIVEKDDYLGITNTHISNIPYLFHCFTLPEFRGNNLHFLATKFILKKYADENKTIWGLVYKNNPIAIKIWKKSGLIPSKKIISYNFLSIFKGHKIVNL